MFHNFQNFLNVPYYRFYQFKGRSTHRKFPIILKVSEQSYVQNKRWDTACIVALFAVYFYTASYYGNNFVVS